MIITIEDDFDLYKIAYSGQCFRVRECEDSSFSFVTGRNRLIIRQVSHKDYDISCSLDDWKSIWSDYFDLDTNYSKIRNSIPDDDSYLKSSAELGKGIRILKQDYFEMLISFIISQRKSIPAIKSSIEKLCNLCGNDGFFPSPMDIFSLSDEALASCGLGYRVAYVKEAAKKVALKEVDLNDFAILNDDELMEQLKSFHGVGDKVANCVALFGYHRIGRAPIDTWILKVIEQQYNGANPFPNYGDYAGIMQQYMFYAASHIKNLK